MDFMLIADKAKELNCKVEFDEPMKNHTSFKVGGNATIFIEVCNTISLKSLLKLIREQNIPVRIIGNGSNILVNDEGINCVVLHLTGEFSDVKLISDNEIESGAGAKLSKLCDFALKNSLSGLEFAWGIPGSVGGATYMNAGAYSGEMKDVIISCTYLDKSGLEHTINSNELDFSYRHSMFSDKGYIITKVKFRLAKAEYNTIKSKMDDLLSRRKSKQPLEYPSAGSTFKRPQGYFAGTLIQECGLKGKRVGGAMVSDKHAGFIINRDEATASDVIKLIKLVQDTVYQKKGVHLDCEVKRWND